MKSKGEMLNSISEDVDKAGDIRSRNGGDKDLEVRIHRNESSFSDLSESWNQLAVNSGSPIYLSPEWTENWWKYFGRNRQRSLFLVTIWDNQKLVALAPLYSGCSTLGSVTVDRRLQIIGSGGSPSEQMGYLDDYGISDFLDFLVDRDFEDIAARKFVTFLGETDVNTITLHQVSDDSFIMRKLYPALRKNGVEPSIVNTDTCPYIDLKNQGSLANYIKQRKSNARRRLRQTLRATGTGKEYVIESPDSAEEVEKAADILIQLHQDRWNELGFPGVFYDRRFKEFFREIIREAHQKKMLWFHHAIDADGICASRMVLFYNGHYYDYISGFDANRPTSKYRPGIGLLLKLVEEALKTGVDRIELLRGEEGYKYDFTDDAFRNWRLTIPGGKKREGVSRAASLVVRTRALAYKYFVREWRLLGVQRAHLGVQGMFQGYIKFRWKSVKLKLNSG